MDGVYPTRRTRTTCPYCGVGCGIIVADDGGGGITVEGDLDHPANLGRLCSKGSALAETFGLDDRLLYPEIDGSRTSWDMALDCVADVFARTISGHGSGSVAFYVSGQLLTEDYYVANKLMKGFVGSANIDTNSRLCMASTVAGQTRAFGGDVVPGCYEDLEEANLIVVVGSNLAWCHPVLFQRIAAEKKRRPGLRIVVIDPRRTVTADAADLHLAIKPDGDVALFNGLLKYLYLTGAADHSFIQAHTNGFETALDHALATDDTEMIRQTGLAADDIRAFYDWFRGTEKTVTVFSQGVNQSTCGTDKVNAVINCHLATGRIGRPGMGPLSVTGQPNAMGGREVGGLANQLAAHMTLDNRDHRDLVQGFWSSPTVADKPGLKAVDMFEAVADGRIKAIWVMATNPVDSLPDNDAVERALAACPFVVVSDVTAETDTTRHAHVRLPALAWGEKDGTVTNSERRISRQRAFLPAPGEARPDWWIISQVAQRMGWRDAFSYDRPADIYREHALLSALGNFRTRAFDIGAQAAIADAAYETMPPYQWPRRTATHREREAKRLFADGQFFTRDGRATFVPVSTPTELDTDPDYPFTLNTGRIRDQWHTMTRTGKAARLCHHIGEPFAAIHPKDAEDLGILDAELVTVNSRKSRITVRALLTTRQERGACFVPMHWNDQFAADARVGTLIGADTDPVSGQPGLKRTAVRLTRFEAKWYGFAVVTTRPRRLDMHYWAVSLIDGGWRVEMAHDEDCADWPYLAERLFGGARSAPGWAAYSDPASGVRRFTYVDDGRVRGALFIAPSPVVVSRRWASDCLGNTDDTNALALLAGRAGAGQLDTGATVCACFNVGINQIVDAVTSGQCMTVDAIGERLGAGSNCGSCRTEIETIIADTRIPA